MLLIVIRIAEIAARALFTIGVTYALPLAEAGRFGILATLIGLSAFAFGWERHIDIQRRLANADPGAFDNAFLNALKMYAFNWLWLAPLLFALAMAWTGIGPSLAAGIVTIAVAEQLSNQLYNLALVERRYTAALLAGALRNLALIAGLALVLTGPGVPLTLELIIVSWAVASLAGVVLGALVWTVTTRGPRPPGEALSIRNQLTRSATHFTIGLLAILVLQVDRLAVGAFLSLEEVGTYFRHVLVVSFAYQLSNIAFYNRALPGVFAAAPTHSTRALARRVLSRAGVTLAVIALGAAGAFALNLASGRVVEDRFDLSPLLAAALLGGAMLRIAADFLSLVLNARMRERVILANQFAAFVFGVAALALLANLYGVLGAALATIVTACVYLVLNARAVRVLPPAA
jgi:O-antigen/teichoic acid export membrane protein